MQEFTEGRHPGEGLHSEAPGSRSREAITIASGSGVVEPGTVLGKVTASDEYAPSPDAETAGIEGAETATAIALYGCDATTEAQAIAAITDDAEWAADTLVFDTSVDDGAKRDAKITQLRAVGIKAR